MASSAPTADEIAEIERLYERDQREGRVAVHADELPIAFDKIAPEWFTEILCGDVPGARVLSFELGPPDDGSTSRRRIFLTYNEVGIQAGLPSSVFAKACHALGSRIVSKLAGCEAAEHSFFRELRPELDLPCPVALYARHDPVSGNAMMLLNDLGGKAEFCTLDTRIDRLRAEDMMHALAAIHGRFHLSRRLTGPGMALRTWPVFWEGQRANGFEAYTNEGFLAAEAVIPSALFRRFEEVWPATQASVDMHQNLPYGLAHGDPHLRNWIISCEGRMGLTDWQGANIGHWSRDLAYAMSSALSVEDRRAWEKELIRVYLDKLRGYGVEEIGFDQAFAWYRTQLFSALAYWTITLRPSPGMAGNMQPEDSTLEIIRRISHAIDDLDAFAAFPR